MIVAAVPGVDGDDLTGERARLDQAAVPVGDLLALAAGLGLAQRLELGQGRRPDDAVGHQARVALEVEDRPFDALVVQAALGAGVEAEQVELDLQGEDVVAAELRLAQVEEPVAERVAALDELAPGVVADLAVDEQAAALLKGQDGEPRARSVEAVDAFVAEHEALAAQAFLHVRDFSAAITEGEVAHRCRSWRGGRWDPVSVYTRLASHEARWPPVRCRGRSARRRP